MDTSVVAEWKKRLAFPEAGKKVNRERSYDCALGASSEWSVKKARNPMVGYAPCDALSSPCTMPIEAKTTRNTTKGDNE
jgi:hypothetical protein